MTESSVRRFGKHLDSTDRSARTIRAYKSDLRAFETWFKQTNGQDLEPGLITFQDLRDYRTYMLKVRQYRPKTINRRLATLSLFFGWAVAKGLTNVNPMDKLGTVDETEVGARWLDRREQRELLRQLEIAVQMARTEPALEMAYRDQAMLVLMMNAGLRISEVSALHKDDLTLRERSGAVVVRAGAGKGGKERTVPLNLSARNALESWLEVRPEDESGAVFTSRAGGRLKPRAIHRRVVHYAKQAHIEEMTPHSLRHTCAKNLVDQGVSLDRVAAILGHADLNTTRIYTQPSQNDLAQEVEKIAWEEE
jgi:integrase/recombinase XerC